MGNKQGKSKGKDKDKGGSKISQGDMAIVWAVSSARLVAACVAGAAIRCGVLKIVPLRCRDSVPFAQSPHYFAAHLVACATCSTARAQDAEGQASAAQEEGAHLPRPSHDALQLFVAAIVSCPEASRLAAVRQAGNVCALANRCKIRLVQVEGTMERNREIAAELLKQGKKVWLSFMCKAQAGSCALADRQVPWHKHPRTETEGACAMALSSCDTFTVANEQDKALLALKRRKMQGKLIEKTDDQVTAASTCRPQAAAGLCKCL